MEVNADKQVTKTGMIKNLILGSLNFGVFIRVSYIGN